MNDIGSTSNISSASAPDREPHITASLREIDDAVKQLDKSIDTLEVRLAPVVRNEPVAALDKRLQASRVPLSVAIDGATAAVIAAITRIQSMISRVEL